MGVLTIVLNLILIPILNMYGACLSVLISIVLYNIFKFVFIYKKWKIQPFTLNTLKVILLLAILVFVSYLFPKLHNPILQIIMVSVPIIIIYSAACYFLKVSDDANDLADKVFLKVKNIVKSKK